MSKGEADRSGFARIARGLSDLLNLLSELDASAVPRRGRREKNGIVVEYSFGTRTAAEAARQRSDEAAPQRGAETPPGPAAARAPRRRKRVAESDSVDAASDPVDAASDPSDPVDPASNPVDPVSDLVDPVEPVTDVFDEPGEVVLLFELPGVSRQQIRCRLDGDILVLEAAGGGHSYRKEILIEPRLAETAPRLHLRNGILEVRLAKEA